MESYYDDASPRLSKEEPLEKAVGDLCVRARLDGSRLRGQKSRGVVAAMHREEGDRGGSVVC